MLTLYIIAGLLSLLIGFFASKKLIVVGKGDKSSLLSLIKLFSALGIGFSVFGLSYLGIHAFVNPYAGEQKYEKMQQRSDANGTTLIEEIREGFDTETLNFEDDSVDTATIFFTLGGIFLGALGIFWLGYLEETRLQKDRFHDQKVQQDRILSLLSLGIDLFLYIDNNELDFMYEVDNHLLHTEDAIVWNNKRYVFLTTHYERSASKGTNKTLDLEYEKHLTSLYKYLYQGKNFQRNSILEDIHTIINELQKIFYEKDLILHKDDSRDIRQIFIGLLEQYSDYKNFIEGKTEESDFGILEHQTHNLKLQSLIQATRNGEVKESDTLRPIQYLREKYTGRDLNFYDYFLSNISKEFTGMYLIKESHIYATFNVLSIKDVFATMQVSYLDSEKFFNSYFKASFKKYITEKKEYMEIDLSRKNDLSFENYLEIMQQAFIQIDADIESVKELYGLFDSFVKLHNKFTERES